LQKPVVDSRYYKLFHLKNQLKLLLIRPSEQNGITNKDNSVVLSVTVGVGSSSDPKEYSGLAHLNEHMLFTGSKNYPKTNHLEELINKHNGYINAVTRGFTTTYYMKFDKTGLEEVVQVVADALVNPSLSEKNLKKELNNIKSELAMRRFSEDSMHYYLLRKLSNKKSRMFNDGFGNLLRVNNY
jgi:secreted Zn-dependent insulinase-like peptidase